MGPVQLLGKTEPFQEAMWADVSGGQVFEGNVGPLPIKMACSDGTGRPLLKRGDFGADLIRFGEGEGVELHSHEGDHILFVIKGKGWVTYEGDKHKLNAGLCYLIPGSVEHSILAETELVMIAVGNVHIPVGSDARIQLTERLTSKRQR